MDYDAVYIEVSRTNDPREYNDFCGLLMIERSTVRMRGPPEWSLLNLPYVTVMGVEALMNDNHNLTYMASSSSTTYFPPKRYFVTQPEHTVEEHNVLR